jgi:hypothetical protein
MKAHPKGPSHAIPSSGPAPIVRVRRIFGQSGRVELTGCRSGCPQESPSKGALACNVGLCSNTHLTVSPRPGIINIALILSQETIPTSTPPLSRRLVLPVTVRLRVTE